MWHSCRQYTGPGTCQVAPVAGVLVPTRQLLEMGEPPNPSIHPPQSRETFSLLFSLTTSEPFGETASFALAALLSIVNRLHLFVCTAILFNRLAFSVLHLLALPIIIETKKAKTGGAEKKRS